MRFYFHFVLVALVVGCGTFPRGKQVYRNLGNPTQYVFHAQAPRVEAAIAKVGQLSEVAKVFPVPSEGSFEIGVLPHYSSNYWRGRIETEVDPPEAGKIGEIQGDFYIRVVPQGEQTLVVVEPDKLTQQIGRTYSNYPHFRKTGVSMRVMSDSYFEYLFLRKLGKLLGEEDMPEMKH